MARLLAALSLVAALALPTAPRADAGLNMDKCVYFSWSHVSESPSTFEYRLKNYCERRVYVQVCIPGTRTCRAHYLNSAPRELVRTVQEPTKRGERMTFRAVSN